MSYIVLDLEWNQAYVQKAIAVQKRLSSRLRGEVIQIGAVKLDENGNICGSYSKNVKPKYFCKIHRHVMLLTGITQEMMDMGTPLDRAIESFFSFCGDDAVFLTWGPDDIPMLKAADVATCPANAMEEVKELCDLVLCPCDEGVIADVIEAIEDGRITPKTV